MLIKNFLFIFLLKKCLKLNDKIKFMQNENLYFKYLKIYIT